MAHTHHLPLALRTMLLALLTMALCLGLLPPAAGGEVVVPLFSAPTTAKSDTARSAGKASPVQPHIARQRLVGINFKSLEPRADKKALSLAVQLFDGVAVVAELDRVEVRGPQSYSWFGTVRGLPNSRATLTVVDGVLAGNLVVLDDWHRVKGSYQIDATIDGNYTLQEIDQSAYPTAVSYTHLDVYKRQQ